MSFPYLMKPSRTPSSTLREDCWISWLLEAHSRGGDSKDLGSSYHVIGRINFCGVVWQSEGGGNRISEGWEEDVLREGGYHFLLTIIHCNDSREGSKPSLCSDVPKNILVNPYTSSSVGIHHHWGRGGTNTSLCAEGVPTHRFVHGEESATTYSTIFYPTPLHQEVAIIIDK